MLLLNVLCHLLCHVLGHSVHIKVPEAGAEDLVKNLLCLRKEVLHTVSFEIKVDAEAGVVWWLPKQFL